MSPPIISAKNKGKKYKRFVYFIGVPVFAYWYAKKLVLGVEGGMFKTLYGVYGLPFLLMFPFFLRRFGMFPFFCLMIPLYWIPFGFGLGYFGGLGMKMIPTELGIYFFCAVVLFSNVVSRGERWAKTWHDFPLKPFSVFFFGAITAYLYGRIFLGVAEPESIYMIRVLCIYPAAICFLCMYLIDSKEKAEKLLWIFLGTTVLLGLVILFGKSYSGYIYLSDYAPTSGRLSMMIRVPIPGFSLFLRINPTVGSNLFSMVFSIAFTFWLNETSKLKRFLSLGIIALSVAIMTKTMGRAGIFASVSSAAVIWYVSGHAGLSVRIQNLSKVILFATIIIGVSYSLGMHSESETFRIKSIEIFSNPLHARTAVSRLVVWKQSIPIITKHPFGIGANGLFGISNTYAEMANPWGDIWGVHNLILYLTLFSGVIGTAGFLFIFVWFIKKSRAKLKSRNPGIRLFSIAGIGITTVFFVAGVASPIISNSFIATVFWLPIGVIMAVINLPDENLEIKRTNE